MRNVEIKALVKNVQIFKNRVKTLTDKEPTIIRQQDTFFNIPEGRLKLRKFEKGESELIFYDRPDGEGPKLSTFEICNVASEHTDNLKNVLIRALGENGTVKKTRELFLIGQTRIHLDSVEGLGNFMELEVVLRPEQSFDDGQAIIDDLIAKLGIEKNDMLKGAYRDLLSNK